MKKLFAILVSLTICLSLVLGMASCKKKNKGGEEGTSTVQESESGNNAGESHNDSGSGSGSSESESGSESGSEGGEEEETFTFADIPGFISASEGGADTTVAELIDAYKTAMNASQSYTIHLYLDVSEIASQLNEKIVSATADVYLKGNFDDPYSCDINLEATLVREYEPMLRGGSQDDVAPVEHGDTISETHGLEILIREYGVYEAEYEVYEEEGETYKEYDDEPAYEATYFEYMYINELKVSDLIAMVLEKYDEIKEEYDIPSYIDIVYGFLDAEMFNGILTTDPETGANYVEVEFDFAETVNNILMLLASLRNMTLGDMFGPVVESVKAYLEDDPTVVSMLDDAVAALEIEDVDTFEGLLNMLEAEHPYVQMLEELAVMGIDDEEMWEFFGQFESYNDLAEFFLYYTVVDETAETPTPGKVKAYTIREFLGNYFDVDLDAILGEVDSFMELTVEEAINLLASIGEEPQGEELSDQENDAEEAPQQEEEEEEVYGVGTMIFDTLEAIEFETIGFNFFAEVLPGDYFGLSFYAGYSMNYTMAPEVDESQDAETPPTPVVENYAMGLYVSCYASISDEEYEYITMEPVDIDPMKIGYLYLDTGNHEFVTYASLEEINEFLGEENSSEDAAKESLYRYVENHLYEFINYNTSYGFYVLFDGEEYSINAELCEYDYDLETNTYTPVSYTCDKDGYLRLVDGWSLEYDYESDKYNCTKLFMITKDGTDTQLAVYVTVVSYDDPIQL